jgi:excinuclease ABC subunit A
VYGARTHNLKGIDLRLPRGKIVVITGISGSGKSSLAFDSIYAEGQRRYIESLSSYARQFLEQMARPDCDRITGLPPTIAIEQHAPGAGPHSTVFTVTEIYDFLRLLFARVGTPHCPQCGREIQHQTLEQITAHLLQLESGTPLVVLAPLVRGRKGHYRELFERLRGQGYVRARIDGEIEDLDDVERVERYKTHDIDLVVDRLVLKNDDDKSGRLRDSLDTAFEIGSGACVVLEGGEERLFSRRFACPDCNVGIEEPTPNMFSFNSPYGRCPECDGRGRVDEFDPELIVPDPKLSIAEGAVEVFEGWPGRAGATLRSNLQALAEALAVDVNTPFGQLSGKKQKGLLYGTGLDGVDGVSPEQAVIPSLERIAENTDSTRTRTRLSRYISPVPCPACKGARLRPESLGVTVGGLGIHEVSAMSVKECSSFFGDLTFSGVKARIAVPIVEEIRRRLQFLMEVGLHYLTGDRLTGTLSTGESQRTRLATQIGSGLTGVCYVLDEPSIGLHHRDHERLLGALERMRDADNTVLVVEHDEETIRRADWVTDLGPGAGRSGGEVVFNGPYADMLECEDSLTAGYLCGDYEIAVPARRRSPRKKGKLVVTGARDHNLKDIDVEFPLGMLICVTGVSGSGKSTLVNDILLRALTREINKSPEKPGRHRAIRGIEHIDRVLEIDQSSIGRTPRSTPATYTKVFDYIRRIFAETKQSRVRGYDVGRFSFNSSEGCCAECGGMGEKPIEMNFLPDMRIECDECHGRRYNQETLQVTVRGKSIADVLEMTVDEALEFFKNYPPVERRLRVMRDVGLGYLTLGQPSSTLSGGEAQRIKLVRELGKVSTGDTLYVLDEPTTGLHFDDISKLLKILHGLVDMGNTVLIIEHNLEVIKNADYVIDLGPEGGDDGGSIVATGTPEEVAEEKNSHTGRALKKLLR